MALYRAVERPTDVSSICRHWSWAPHLQFAVWPRDVAIHAHSYNQAAHLRHVRRQHERKDKIDNHDMRRSCSSPLVFDLSKILEVNEKRPILAWPEVQPRYHQLVVAGLTLSALSPPLGTHNLFSNAQERDQVAYFESVSGLWRLITGALVYYWCLDSNVPTWVLDE